MYIDNGALFCCRNYCILFSHPRDFTPVCTTELAALGLMKPEFDKRHTKLIALSCDTVAEHMGWLAVSETYSPNRPTIWDQNDLNLPYQRCAVQGPL